MILHDLIKHIPGARLIGDGTVGVHLPKYDSRLVKPGDLFCALRGEQVDGNRYVETAVKAGATAVLTAYPTSDPGVPTIYVQSDREGMAYASHALYGDPTSRVKIIGVTGTNGKTTTTHILQSIINAAGGRCGRIGTVGWEFSGKSKPLARTTPEAPDLLGVIADMEDAGATHIAMEVTSIAMPMKRVEGFKWTAGLFMNLSQDHLDLHGTMEEYFLAKKTFFKDLPEPASAIANADDPYGNRILQGISARCVRYSLVEHADVVGEIIREGNEGLTISITYLEGCFEVTAPYVGRFNAENVLGAVATALMLGISPKQIQRGVAGAPQVRGRMERLLLGSSVTAVVDYAHTPAALERALLALRPMTRGKLIVVFGAGGDRDRQKRAVMGQVAAENADRVIVTSDNPRSEDPDAIIEEILEGAKGKHVVSVPDRKEAIVHALEIARKGDVVLVAGKGHETYQEINGVRHPFDDREEVLKAGAEVSC
ncbi:MAG: UDP-N-acetylmuramoyl-L-alanyl-D-glutamate--2,6-diaminopimelate ligase [bacterium]